MLLALDTATAVVTVALHDGVSVLAERSVADGRRHAEHLAPAVAAVLDDAGVDRRVITAIAVGVGPGPFTGLRVGLVTARTLGRVLAVGVHGVCTLDVLAEEAVAGGRTGSFLVATDARRREVYWARYDVVEGQGGPRPFRRDGPHVDAPGIVATRAEVPPDVVGRGALLYPDDLGPAGRPLDPSAAVLAAVAARALACGGEGLLPADPLYLRRPDAAEPGARKRVLR
jgi:tRNA threonylcarbamoyl adenosine modification protein YeaZ